MRFIAVGDIVAFPVDVDAVGTVSSFVERTAAMLLVLGLVLVGTSVFDLVIRRAQDGRKISIVCVFLYIALVMFARDCSEFGDCIFV